MVETKDARDRSPLLNYGSEVENDKLPLPILRRRERPSVTAFLRKPSSFYVINGIVLLAVVSVCLSMRSTIVRLETQLTKKDATISKL